MGWRLLSRVTPKGNKKDNKEKDNKTLQLFIFSSQCQAFQESLMPAYRFTVPQAQGAKGQLTLLGSFREGLRRRDRPTGWQQGPAKASLLSS